MRNVALPGLIISLLSELHGHPPKSEDRASQLEAEYGSVVSWWRERTKNLIHIIERGLVCIATRWWGVQVGH